LAVALVAVAVLVARGVRERRAHLAVLRVVGFRRRDVVLMLLAEPLLQAATGIVIGLGSGLLVLWLLFTRGFADLAFVVSWAQIGIMSAATLGLVLAGCLVPAVVGARRDVATGLRDLG
jgi:putative ABC transport system permease protein